MVIPDIEGRSGSDNQDMLLEIQTWLARLDGIRQAKEKAYITVGLTVQQCVRRRIQEIRRQEERLLAELWAGHQCDINAIQKIQNKAVKNLKDSGEEELKYQYMEEVRDSIVDFLSANSDVVNFVEGEAAVRMVGHLEKKPRKGMTDSVQSVLRTSVASIQIQNATQSNDGIKHVPSPEDRKLLRRTQSERRRASIQLWRRERTASDTTHMPRIRRPSGRIQTTAELLLTLDDIGSGLGQIRRPTDVALLGNGNMLIAEAGNRRVQELTRTGRPVQVYEQSHIKPCAVIQTKESYISVLDSYDKNIKVYTSGARLMCSFGTGYFNNPSALAATSTGSYVVIDNQASWLPSVLLYNPISGLYSQLGFDSDGSYVLNNPEDVAVDLEDRIYLTDAGHHCVFMFSTDGALLGKFAEAGIKSGQLFHPKGLAVDHSGNILVSDCGNHRISKFTPQGLFLKHVLGKDDGLCYPLNIAIDAGNKLAVVQSNQVRLYQLSGWTTDVDMTSANAEPKTGTFLQPTSIGEKAQTFSGARTAARKMYHFVRQNSTSDNEPMDDTASESSAGTLTTSSAIPGGSLLDLERGMLI